MKHDCFNFLDKAIRKTDEWETRFDEMFAEDLADLEAGFWSELRTKKLKSFIRNLLKDEERH